MKPVWNDAEDAPLASDGRAVVVGHIGTKAQAKRWQAKGYDIAAATDRYVAFHARWESAKDEASADALVDAFYFAERTVAEGFGIDALDPDHFRLVTAAKHHEWV